jgi:hypothetical protein
MPPGGYYPLALQKSLLFGRTVPWDVHFARDFAQIIVRDHFTFLTAALLALDV